MIQKNKMCYNIYRWMIYISSSYEKKLCNHSTMAPFEIQDQSQDWFFYV